MYQTSSLGYRSRKYPLQASSSKSSVLSNCKHEGRSSSDESSSNSRSSGSFSGRIPSKSMINSRDSQSTARSSSIGRSSGSSSASHSSTFADKFDRWKRRINNRTASSSPVIIRKTTKLTPKRSRSPLPKFLTPKSSRHQQVNKVDSRNKEENKRRVTSFLSKKYPSRQNHDLNQSRKVNSTSRRSRDTSLSRKRDHDRNTTENSTSLSSKDENMYYQVMDGMSKMTSSSSKDDHSPTTATTVTATSTQPSSSSFVDDGSTIVSEVTAEVATRLASSSSISTKSSSSITQPLRYEHHTFKAGNQNFTIDKRYGFIRTVGSGAYGVVISAKDYNGEKNVAIKMVPRAFHDEIDAKRILREIKLLKHFCHENIIGIVDMMPPIKARHVEDFNDVYIVTDLMETDLHRIIYSKQSLSIDHVQYFVYQILRALKYMHSAEVLHRDLKPSNLLVNSNCDLKVCDFGLARGVCEDFSEDCMNGGSMLLTEYVVTRWYRAPEIMLACHKYSKPVDIWSVGCIFAELLNRKPYFPGDDYIQQLTIISEKLGKLEEKDLDFVTSEKAKKFMRKLPDKLPIPLRRQFPKNTPHDALDLLEKMLQIHPRKRVNVVEALEHPFLSSLHNPEDEPIAHNPFNFSFENEKLHRLRLQELIWKEIGDFRPSCLPVPPCKESQDKAKESFCEKLYYS